MYVENAMYNDHLLNCGGMSWLSSTQHTCHHVGDANFALFRDYKIILALSCRRMCGIGISAMEDLALYSSAMVQPRRATGIPVLDPMYVCINEPNLVY